MLKQFLAFGVLTAVSGCTINITTEGSHEGFDHEWHGTEEEWIEEKEQWHHDHDGHHGHDHHDDGEWSGFIVEHCWHSEAVREMAAGYCEGEYEAFHDLVDPDAKIMVNDVDLSKDEWIDSLFASEMFLLIIGRSYIPVPYRSENRYIPVQYRYLNRYITVHYRYVNRYIPVQ